MELQEEINQLMSKQKEIQSKLVDTQKKTVKEMDSGKKSSPQPQDVLKVPLVHLEKSVLHRDFKILGVVGEPGQKDKLGYQSLISQVEAGLRKGYTELEVVNAVIRAVQPGLQLRSYQEGAPNLSLPKLRKILRFHFHEKSATELYQILANITQQPKEDPQALLITALTIRQKIIFTSKESGNNITYDESSVQGLFLHALETGLIDETIRAKMRPFLKKADIADEDLIEAMNMALSAETERINKFNFSGRTKPAKISALEMVNDKTKEKREEGRILAALKAVQADLATMHTEINTLHNSVTQVQDPAMRQTSPSCRPKRGCKVCQEKVCPTHVPIALFVVVLTTLPDIAITSTRIRETAKGCPQGTGSSPTQYRSKVPPL